MRMRSRCAYWTTCCLAALLILGEPAGAGSPWDDPPGEPGRVVVSEEALGIAPADPFRSGSTGSGALPTIIQRNAGEARAFPAPQSELDNRRSTGDLLSRLEAAEARINELESLLDAPEPSYRNIYTSYFAESEEDSKPKEPDWEAGYEGGFYIRPTDPDKNPFMISIGGRMQFRHTAFARDEETWTDNAGVTRVVMDRNYFEIERGRLDFEGYFLSEDLEYYINFDFDTDDEHNVIAHDFWINYNFCPAFNLFWGKAFVPGSRDWLNGSTRTRFADRSMATTFFRPDRSVGVWAEGEPIETLFYRAMVGNGFNSTDLTQSELDNQFVYSMSVWKDVGDFGRGYSDLEWHEAPAAQIGNSFTTASMRDNGLGGPTPEQNFVRLTDGTVLIQPGALAPGVTVDHFDIYLYAVDAAFKWRGFSANAECFFRWVQSISGNGPLPIHQFSDHGYYAEAGYMIIPECLELNARVSQIYGDFGDAREYAGGVNWFINGTHNCKLTLDVTSLENCPANNSGPNYRAGDDGLMIRTQLQTAF